MSLSKTKYCRGIQCPKMLWLDKNNPSVADLSLVNESVFDNGNEVGDLAMKYFGDFTEIPYNEDYNKMIIDTIEEINKGTKVICEASFNFNGNFCSVDILKKEKNGFSIYEVKSSAEVKDIYVDDASYQYYILTNLGYKINSVNIMHLNPLYVRNGELRLNKLFDVCDITSLVLDKQDLVPDNIDKFNAIINQKNYDNDLGIYCEKPYSCIYKNYCMKDLPENNIFNVCGMPFKKKIEFYKKNIISFKDILNSDEKLTSKNIDQIKGELNNYNICNIQNISDFLDSLTYPLYFLDFETFQQSIPLWDGVSPYMQIPFQYSLHYRNNKNEELFHKEFLAEAFINPMRDLALSLVNDIPKDVCVLAYNMSFEKNVIKKLAGLYPDLSDHLLNIYDNMHDLMVPFFKHDYYIKEMKGSYSIKYVLPALFPNDDELNYHNLEEIHNGSEAMNAYFNLSSKSIEEINETRSNLLKYCCLDTYAMVKILDKLEEIVDENKKCRNRY